MPSRHQKASQQRRTNHCERSGYETDVSNVVEVEEVQVEVRVSLMRQSDDNWTRSSRMAGRMPERKK
jgi:hypothetical protein